MVTESATSALETPNASKLLGLTGTLGKKILKYQIYESNVQNYPRLQNWCRNVCRSTHSSRNSARPIDESTSAPTTVSNRPKSICSEVVRPEIMSMISNVLAMVSMPSITTSLQQSPSIFSNIGFLQPNSEGTDNITTADFSKLVSSVRFMIFYRGKLVKNMERGKLYLIKWRNTIATWENN